MARPRRTSPRDLNAELLADAPAFRFFQAVRLVELTQGSTPPADANPPPSRLRFATPATLNFPASEIQSLQATEGGATLSVSFMGLTGPSGALPTAYTELLIERQHRHRDSAAHAFLDLFSHRAIDLFYRAWKKHRFYLAHESGEADRFARHLLDLVGVGLQKLQQRLEKHGHGIPDRFLIHYAGLLAQRPVPAANLGALVSGYFGVPARVEQFVGHWLTLPSSEQSRPGHTHATLGQDAFLGARQWDRQTKLRLVIGPLTHTQLEHLLPGGANMLALKELTHFALGHSLACDVQLILKKEEIPPPVLKHDGLRLGYNTWLHVQPPRTDSGDVCFGLLH